MKLKIKSISSIVTLCLLILSQTALSSPTEKGPLTVAESSNFTATSRHEDVIKFIREMQQLSPLFRVETLCLSPEGREVPLLIVGNPPPSSQEELNYDERAVIYIQANIHAGEVEGKEATLMLLRDILLQENPPYLDKLVILMCPIFNADGNEKIDPANRRNQVGPEKGVGVRYNGQNLDLNRDGMKMESPEVQGLARNVLNRWDPVLLVDCHTTNGSYHKEPVTYVWQLNPNGDTSIIKHMREKMMPTVDKSLEEKYNTLSIPYGNFMDYKDMEKGWRPAGPQPRYLTNYIGLRNRMAILLENYAYADYKTRVMGNYHFLLSVLDYCHANKNEILQIIRETDQNTVKRGLSPSENDRFAITYDVKALKDPITILGWEIKIEKTEGRRPRRVRTDIEKVYTLPYYCDYIPKDTVPFPYGYLITVSDAEILNKLLQHGVVVEKLLKPTSMEVQKFLVKEVKGMERLYQGHRWNSVKGEFAMEKRVFPEGTYFVGTAQPLANLIAYLLEPQSDDGLVVWNYFDRYLVPQWGRGTQTYPVFKLLKPVTLVKEIIRK
jgi:hypothetical protein